MYTPGLLDVQSKFKVNVLQCPVTDRRLEDRLMLWLLGNVIDSALFFIRL